MSEEDAKQALDNLTRKSAILIALCVSPMLFLFGDSGKGRAAAICAFAIVLCARVFWSLKTRVLFWLVLTIVTLCHIPLILFIPWTDRDYPGVVLLPVALLDFAIVYGVFRLVEKMMKRGEPDADTNREA